tara:strand:+ start:724 stop:1686 length:963 start_codon:yes stop_codon:yes gene_type:complete
MISNTRQKFLIIGGGGFLGYSLYQRLRKNYQPAVFVSSSFQWSNLGKIDDVEHISFVIANSKDIDMYKDFISDVSHVIYMAGGTNIAYSQLHSISDIENHNSAILPLLTSLDPSKKLIYISSGGAVYGETSDFIDGCTETSTLNPKSIYGLRNKVMENLVSSYCKYASISYAILRLSNPFGISQTFTKRKGLIMTAILNALQNKPLLLRDNGQQFRDFIPVDLFVDYLLAIAADLGNKSSFPALFNVGLGKSYSTLAIAEMINELLGGQLNIQIKEECLPYEVKHSSLDCSLISNMYPAIEKKPLDQYLYSLVRLIQENS